MSELVHIIPFLYLTLFICLFLYISSLYSNLTMVIFPFFCMALFLSLFTLLSPSLSLIAGRAAREISSYPLPPFTTCRWWSVCEYIQPTDHTGTHRDRLMVQTGIPSLCPIPVIQAFPFISGCLLAGCCLLVAAACKHAIVHSWSSALRSVFVIGGEFSQCPSPSVSGMLLHFPTEKRPHPPLFFIHLHPHHLSLYLFQPSHRCRFAPHQ